MDLREYEQKLVANDVQSKRMKAQAFEREMDRLNDSMKRAESKEDLARHAKFKDYVLDKYNKYRNTSHRS